MAPLSRIYHTLTSSSANPTWGPMIVVAARSAAVIFTLRTVDHLYPLKTAARYVSGGGGAVLPQVCHTAPDGCHCTCAGVSYCAVSNRFSFDAIFLRCKEEANEGGGGVGGREIFGGLGGLNYHKELDVAKGKGGGDCVCSTRTVFSGSEEEEERDPGEI